MQFSKFRFLTLLCFIATIAFSACSDSSTVVDDTTVPPAGLATVSAVVDGNVWQSSDDGPHSPVGAVGLVNTSLNILIQAYASDGSYIALNVVSTSAISENTPYLSSDGLFQAQYHEDFNDGNAFFSLLGSGTLTFTNISDDNITGTFSFNAVNATGGSHAVDNGSFNVDL